MNVRSIALAVTTLVISTSVNSALIETDPHAFRIRFYQNLGGQPDVNSFFEQTIMVSAGNEIPLITPDGTVNTAFEYNATINPVTLTANVNYWVEISEADETTPINSWVIAESTPDSSSQGLIRRFDDQESWFIQPRANRGELAFSIGNEFQQLPTAQKSGLVSGLLLGEQKAVDNFFLLQDTTVTEIGWVGKYGVVAPIPAAIWLFGSGLLGLIGVARRKA